MLGHPAAAASPREFTVLVIYSSSRLLPANIEGDRGFRQVVRSTAERPVLIVDEYLDLPRLGGPAYEQILRTYLHDKYAPRAPDLVVAAGDTALVFLLANRAQLFAGLPMVHMGVMASTLRAIAPPPPEVVGVPVELDFAANIEQALRLHPNARRVVVVTGASPVDRGFESRLRQVAPRFESRAPLEFLSGLSNAAVLKRLAAPGNEAIVFTPGYFKDADGLSFTPRAAAEAMAAVSTAPLFGPFNTFIGAGAVGGVMANFEAMGRQAGEIVNALLDGAAPASLTLPKAMPSALNLDWRQVQRWGIDERLIPPDAVLHFREPTLWETRRLEVSAAVAVFMLQALLIGGLVFERRRRREAEVVAQKQRAELAHAGRLAVAGELTGAIAHEINQPLGAILSNADTAERLLESGTGSRDELRGILADIRRDDIRAGQVVRRLRLLLSKHVVERQPFDLNEAIRDTVQLLEAEARRREVALDLRLAPYAITMVGDRLQIQQVMINLLLNAMDALGGLPQTRRTVTLATRSDGREAHVTVRDRGTGFTDDQLPKLFDSFFTTKEQGMGLGLSIVRTLLEAHGGRIRAENAAEGAVFHIELPCAEEAAMAVSLSAST